MVGWAEIECSGGTAGEPVHQAAIEAKRHHAAGEVRGLARADIMKTRQRYRSDGIVVANDCRGPSVQRGGDVGELAPIQELAMGEMDVGERDVAYLDDLCPPARQAARQA